MNAPTAPPTRKHQISILVLFIILFSLGSIHTGTDTISASDGGDGPHYIVTGGGTHGFKTIQSAIDEAQDGYTIYVWDGYYSETVTIDKEIRLIGNGTERTRLSTFYGGIKITSENVEVSGMSLLGGDRGSYLYALVLEDAENVTISDMYVENTRFGLAASNCSDIHIKDCELTEHETAMYFRVSPSSTVRIQGNTINGTEIGIWMGVSCDGFVITDNTIDCTRTGLSIYNSNGAIIEGNFIGGGNVGNRKLADMELSSSSEIVFCDNLLGGGGISLFGNDLRHWNSHSMTGNTFIDGGDMLYLNGVDGKLIGGDLKQAILADCSNVTIKGQSFDAHASGVDVAFCRDITLEDCDFNNFRDAIRLSNCWDSVVKGCTVRTVQEAITLDDSSHNLITNNSCDNYAYSGITLWSSDNNMISDNDCRNGWRGITLYSSENNMVSGNDISNCSKEGMRLSMGGNNSILENNCSYNSAEGIRGEEDNLNIVRNIVEHNDLDGIHIRGDSSLLEKNICRYNGLNGIYIAGEYGYNNAGGSYFDGNTLSYNEYSGALIAAFDLNFTNNICQHNNRHGLELSGGFYTHNHIHYNTFESNVLTSMDLSNTMDARIHHNNFINTSVDGDNVDDLVWDNGAGEGNYWWDYNGLDDGSGYRVSNDGIGDTLLPFRGYDYYPFMDRSGWLKPMITDSPEMVVDESSASDGMYTITWEPVMNATGYILEESKDEYFSVPTQIYSGGNFSYLVDDSAEHDRYFRVKGYNDDYHGNWSTTLMIPGVDEHVPENSKGGDGGESTTVPNLSLLIGSITAVAIILSVVFIIIIGRRSGKG